MQLENLIDVPLIVENGLNLVIKRSPLDTVLKKALCVWLKTKRSIVCVLVLFSSNVKLFHS